jgi:hypothetical protein
MERDRHRQLKEHHDKTLKEEKQKLLFKNLRKEVTTGANGTQDYIIKKGINSGKIADKGQ